LALAPPNLAVELACSPCTTGPQFPARYYISRQLRAGVSRAVAQLLIGSSEPDQQSRPAKGTRLLVSNQSKNSVFLSMGLTTNTTLQAFLTCWSSSLGNRQQLRYCRLPRPPPELPPTTTWSFAVADHLYLCRELVRCALALNAKNPTTNKRPPPGHPQLHFKRISIHDHVHCLRRRRLPEQR